jgi:hypothetical protein
MNRAIRSVRAAAWLVPVLLTALVATPALVAPLPGGGPGKPPEGGAGKTSPSAAAAVEVRFTDDSVLKMTLRDQRIEISTQYGKLLVPVADIHKIEFATRLADDVARRVDAAVADLASPQFKVREAATAELLKLREKAYPALLQAAEQKDAEVARRAKDLLEKIREEVPEEALQVRKQDVIVTGQSKIAGRIDGATLRASTTQFGDVQLKLADVRSLRSLATVANPEVAKALPDPGTLVNFQGQLGKTLLFKVTGTVTGSLWGTDVYTTDSTLAAAAVHAGILQAGQTGVIKVAIVPAPAAYLGSTRNGVTSSPYQAYPSAYKVSKLEPPKEE